MIDRYDLLIDSEVQILDTKETIIANAIKFKDITPEMAVTLRNNHKDSPAKLFELISAFSYDRLMYLMSLPYDELDKSDKMNELHDKYLQGYKRKISVETGNVEKVIKENIDNGWIDEDFIKGFVWRNGKITPAIINPIYDHIDFIITQLMKRSWSELNTIPRADESTLNNTTTVITERLKQNYFMGFRQKYFQAFGTEYKEPLKK